MKAAFFGAFSRALFLLMPVVGVTDSTPAVASRPAMEIIGDAELFAPGVISTAASHVRLTLSPDGKTAAWFARNRAGGPGDYDIWISKCSSTGWGAAAPASFNSPQRDFDPAFAADGRFIYFCSSRPGGLGGDDLYRVPVLSESFGAVEHLGANVNSAGDEWAPMLSPDSNTLLFSSNGRGAQRFDLFVARRRADNSFAPAATLPGAINTAADEFDATFLADNTTIVFSRAPDINVDRITLAYASLTNEGYDAGTVLPPSVNAVGQNTYRPHAGLVSARPPYHLEPTARSACRQHGPICASLSPDSTALRASIAPWWPSSDSAARECPDRAAREIDVPVDPKLA